MMKFKPVIPVLFAAMLIPASAALAQSRWDRDSRGDRGYNYDRGNRYVDSRSSGSWRGSSRHDGYWGSRHGWSGHSRSRSSVSFSFGFSNFGGYNDYFVGGGYSSGYYRPRVVYSDTYFCNPPVRVYSPPVVVYRPPPRVYYYDGCSTGSSFAVSGSYYYRR